MKKLFIALCFISMFLIITSIQISAQEIIYGCVNTRDGKLRIVTGPGDCHPKKETDIFWHKTGTSGARAHSATDEYLGLITDLHLVSYAGETTKVVVFIEEEKRFLHIIANNGENYYEPIENGDPYFYYEDANCTGTPYIDVGTEITYNILTNYFSGTAKHFKVVGAVTTPPVTILARYSDGNEGCEPYSRTFEYGGYILEEVTLPFSYPVAIPLIIK